VTDVTAIWPARLRFLRRTVPGASLAPAISLLQNRLTALLLRSMPHSSLDGRCLSERHLVLVRVIDPLEMGCEWIVRSASVPECRAGYRACRTG
jgi:hypothetical protein